MSVTVKTDKTDNIIQYRFTRKRDNRRQVAVSALPPFKIPGWRTQISPLAPHLAFLSFAPPPTPSPDFIVVLLPPTSLADACACACACAGTLTLTNPVPVPVP